MSKDAQVNFLKTRRHQLKNEVKFMKDTHQVSEKKYEKELEKLRQRIRELEVLYKDEKSRVDEYEGIFEAFKRDKERLCHVVNEKTHQNKKLDEKYRHELSKTKYLLNHHKKETAKSKKIQVVQKHRIKTVQNSLEKHQLLHEEQMGLENRKIEHQKGEIAKLQRTIKDLHFEIQKLHEKNSRSNILVEQWKVKHMKRLDDIKVLRKNQSDDHSHYVDIVASLKQSREREEDLKEENTRLKYSNHQIAIYEGKINELKQEVQHQKNLQKKAKKEMVHYQEVCESLTRQMTVREQEHMVSFQDLKIKYEHEEGIKLSELREQKRKLKTELRESKEREGEFKNLGDKLKEKVKTLKEELVTVRVDTRSMVRSRRRSSAYRNPNAHLRRRAVSAMKSRQDFGTGKVTFYSPPPTGRARARSRSRSKKRRTSRSSQKKLDEPNEFRRRRASSIRRDITDIRLEVKKLKNEELSSVEKAKKQGRGENGKKNLKRSSLPNIKMKNGKKSLTLNIPKSRWEGDKREVEN